MKRKILIKLLLFKNILTKGGNKLFLFQQFLQKEGNLFRLFLKKKIFSSYKFIEKQFL